MFSIVFVHQVGISFVNFGRVTRFPLVSNTILDPFRGEVSKPQVTTVTSHCDSPSQAATLAFAGC